MADALKKCPDIMIIPPEHEYYHEQSRKFISILKEYTSDIEQVSVENVILITREFKINSVHT